MTSTPEGVTPCHGLLSRLTPFPKDKKTMEKTTCERCSQPIPAARLKRSTTCSAQCASAVRQARKRSQNAGGPAKPEPPRSPRERPAAADMALAQAQVRHLRSCDCEVQDLIDVLNDEHPDYRPWTIREVEKLEAARFTGEELAEVRQRLEEWKRACGI